MTRNEKDTVVTVRVTEDLKNDAKENTEHGEISKELRDVLRRLAYGKSSIESRREKIKWKLRRKRDLIDEKRRERRRIDAEIDSLESEAARLEAELSEMEERSDAKSVLIDQLDHQLNQGERVTPEKIGDQFDADEIISELMNRNPDVPDAAFRSPNPGEPWNWKAAETGVSDESLIQPNGMTAGGDP